MLKYIIKRVLYFVPTMLVISIIVFGLSKIVPGDIVEHKLQVNPESVTEQGISDVTYEHTARELGLDKPHFYFTIISSAFPKNLYTILKKDRRIATENLIKQYGNAQQIALFHQTVQDFLKKTNPNDTLNLRNNALQLLIQDDNEKISTIINEMKLAVVSQPTVETEVNNIFNQYQKVIVEQTRYKLYIPVFYWYGFDNQYHHWLTGFLSGNWGTTNSGQTVLEKIRRPLSITLIMSISAIIVSFALAIPIGIYTAAHKNTMLGKNLMRVLFALYSMPIFWVALMALKFLTTPQYGMKIFPSAGLSDVYTEESFWIFWLNNFSRITLPILCMAIHPIAVIARLLQGAMIHNLESDYIRTARAKGLSEKRILNHHAFRNALFPLITLLGQLMPILITGSFIIENIFNIEGMGRVAYEAFQGQDWQLVYIVLLLSAVMILVSNLISDILYKWANPRVEL